MTGQVLQRFHNSGLPSDIIDATQGTLDDAEATLSVARSHGATWVLADGYRLGLEWQSRIRRAIQLGLFDDFSHADTYDVDLIINQNAYASALNYNGKVQRCRFLLGPQYVQLREEFLMYRGWQRGVLQRRLLVTMGGSDPVNATGQVLSSLQHWDRGDWSLAVIVGTANANAPELLSRCQEMEVEAIESPSNMAEVLARAGIAIAAGGTTTWESVFLGLPGVYLSIADNQDGIVESVRQHRLGVSLGRISTNAIHRVASQVDWLRSQSAEYWAISRRAQALVDGYGGERVVAALA
jgi:UDP-2,4-diacetamido-2,4,6-trideoxy-beta-L-altropyranose hydrolase